MFVTSVLSYLCHAWPCLVTIFRNEKRDINIDLAMVASQWLKEVVYNI